VIFSIYGIAAMLLTVLGIATLRAGTASMFLSVHRPRNGGLNALKLLPKIADTKHPCRERLMQ
jgi:hypothetical protein